MHRIIIFSLAVCFLLVGNTASADSIYTWTDSDGVKRYSNSQPPENTPDVQTIEEIPYDQGNEDRNRQAFDRMVDEASQRADQQFEQQEREKAQDAAAEQERQQQARAEQVATQRAELQKEIDAIQARGLGPTFTQGMKDNLINQIQDQIDQLEGGLE